MHCFLSYIVSDKLADKTSFEGNWSFFLWLLLIFFSLCGLFISFIMMSRGMDFFKLFPVEFVELLACVALCLLSVLKSFQTFYLLPHFLSPLLWVIFSRLLCPWYSECGPWISSRVTWEHVRNAKPQVLPHTYYNRTWILTWSPSDLHA